MSIERVELSRELLEAVDNPKNKHIFGDATEEPHRVAEQQKAIEKGLVNPKVLYELSDEPSAPEEVSSK